MTTDIDELLSSIQGLARTIHAETGLYVVYSEHLHRGGAVAVDISVEVGGDFRWWRGSNMPIEGHQVTLETVREQMLEWLVEQRKEAA